MELLEHTSRSLLLILPKLELALIVLSQMQPTGLKLVTQLKSMDVLSLVLKATPTTPFAIASTALKAVITTFFNNHSTVENLAATPPTSPKTKLAPRQPIAPILDLFASMPLTVTMVWLVLWTDVSCSLLLAPITAIGPST